MCLLSITYFIIAVETPLQARGEGTSPMAVCLMILCCATAWFKTRRRAVLSHCAATRSPPSILPDKLYAVCLWGHTIPGPPSLQILTTSFSQSSSTFDFQRGSPRRGLMGGKKNTHERRLNNTHSSGRARCWVCCSRLLAGFDHPLVVIDSAKPRVTSSNSDWRVRCIA